MDFDSDINTSNKIVCTRNWAWSFFKANIPFHFLHPSLDRHLGCVHVLAIVNSATVNMGIQKSQDLDFNSFVYISRGGLPNHMVALF